jgi:hypothetical protein
VDRNGPTLLQFALKQKYRRVNLRVRRPTGATTHWIKCSFGVEVGLGVGRAIPVAMEMAFRRWLERAAEKVAVRSADFPR